MIIDIKEIFDILPHRYPFLMVDRIIALEPSVSITGIKNVTINEPYFNGHFPSNPVMPGVMIVEALAQTGGILAYKSGEKGSKIYFMSIESAKFRKPVIPGDVLKLHVEVIHKRKTVWKFKGKATVNDVVVSEAEFTAMLTD